MMYDGINVSSTATTRFTLIWTVVSSLVMLAVGLATTAIPMVGRAR